MPRTRCAIVAVAVAGWTLASLAVTGVAQATPATPTITVAQTNPLKVRLTSSTGTHWTWTIVDAANNVVATSTTNPATPTLPAAGDYTAQLSATDDDPLLTAPATAQKTFHVYAKPVAAFTSTTLANGTVQFTDASTNEPIGWTWTFPNGTTYKDKTPPPQSLPVGVSNVTLKVTNPAGNGNVTQAVVVNGPPTAVLNIMSTPAAISSPILLDAGRSTDPNQDPLTYAWDLDGNGSYADGAGPLQSVSYAGPGLYRVGVQVSDGHGGVSTTDAFITVLADKPPAVDFSNTPVQPMAGAPVSFTATFSDPDGTVTKVDWDIDDDGAFDDAAGPTATWTFPAPGPKLVAVRATDDRGVATIAFRTITVTAPPALVAPTSVTVPPTGSSAPPPSPSSASGTPIPRVPAPSSNRLPLITPFPVVRIRGLLYHGAVRISLLKVEAPRGATIRMRCRGSSCAPRKGGDLRVKVARAPVRLRTLEHRSLKPGTLIEVFITAPGRIGKYTRFKVRADAAPARSDLCLQPGRKTPMTCPAA
jgi:PKD repeat protein